MPLIDIIGIIYLFDHHKCGGKSTANVHSFKTNLKPLLAYAGELNDRFALTSGQKSVHRGLPVGSIFFFSIHWRMSESYSSFNVYASVLIYCHEILEGKHIDSWYVKKRSRIWNQIPKSFPPYGNQMISNSKFLTVLKSWNISTYWLKWGGGIRRSQDLPICPAAFGLLNDGVQIPSFPTLDTKSTHIVNKCTRILFGLNQVVSVSSKLTVTNAVLIKRAVNHIF